MNDMLPVEIPQGRGHLRDILRGLPLGEPRLPPEMLIQLSLAGEFQDQEDAFGIVKVPVELEDVGMAQVGLDLDLTTDLFLYAAAVLELGFVQDFEGADEVGGAFAGEVDTAEFALA